MKDYPFKIKEKYEEQTRIKHLVFNDYIDKWIKIVGVNSKLIFIDGFGGIGAYKCTEGKIHYGSPILAAKAIETNKTNLQRTVQMLIIDNEEEYLENIKKIFKYEKINIKPTCIHLDFDKAINDFIDQSRNLIPIFVLIDPYGFTIKVDTIRRIMNINKSEVLINFMYTRINQFLTYSSLEQTYEDLFGNTDWKDCGNLSGDKREQCIVSCYRNELKKFTKFVYPFKLEMPKTDRTYFYLFHLTNYFKGCEIMKSIFAKHNDGRLEYLGNRSNQYSLFETEDYMILQTGNYLLDKYHGQVITYKKILENELDETNFLGSNIRKSIINKENKYLSVRRIPKNKTGQRRKNSLTYDDVITFKKKEC